MKPIKYDPYVFKPVEAFQDCFIQCLMPIGEKLQTISCKIIVEDKGYQEA
jgi:hypothetical protein